MILRKTYSPLSRLILEQIPSYSFEVLKEQMIAKVEIHKQRRKQQSDSAEHVMSSLSNQRVMKLAQEN